MIEKFPLDDGNLWEGDLEKAIYLTACANFKKVYFADVKRFGMWVDIKDAEEENNLFKQLIAAGKTNVESFIAFGRKYLNAEAIPAAIVGFNTYLTACTNEIFKYICNSEISMDDIFLDYSELSKYAQTNTTIRFGLNMINQVITQLVEINSSIDNCLVLDKCGLTENMAYTYYKIRLSFYKVPMFMVAAINDPEHNQPRMDKTGLYLEVKKNSNLYSRLKETFDGNFNNRVLRLYLSNWDSSQSLRMVSVYQTLTDDYKIRLL